MDKMLVAKSNELVYPEKNVMAKLIWYRTVTKFNLSALQKKQMLNTIKDYMETMKIHLIRKITTLIMDTNQDMFTTKNLVKLV